MCQSTIQSNRGPLYKISNAKIKGMIDTIKDLEKGKPGVGTYKGVSKSKEFTMDRTGNFNGLCKSNVE